uniref:Uncharacterized protein n=1 Tax=Parascaris univalens TaxID=6257 RepID=A0A914ZZ32_PARUN
IENHPEDQEVAAVGDLTQRSDRFILLHRCCSNFFCKFQHFAVISCSAKERISSHLMIVDRNGTFCLKMCTFRVLSG